MLFKLQNTTPHPYLECTSNQIIIQNQNDILDLIALCGEHDTNLIMFYEHNLPPAFFNLKTGLAGELFQKFANYRIKAAAIISINNIKSKRFKELIYEHNRSNLFRFFEDREAAQAWLTK